MKVHRALGIVVVGIAALFAAVDRAAPRGKNFLRYEIQGTTGEVVETIVTVKQPTLLQPFRENWFGTSGVGDVRIGARPSSMALPEGSLLTYPGSWVNGDLWLPFAGDWVVSVWSQAEDRLDGISFCLPYVGLPSPDEATLAVARTGAYGGRESYHYELHVEGSAWNQVMKLEQRLIARQVGTLSVRCGAIRYRWGGPPDGDLNSDGGAYDVLLPGETLRVDPMPLASLWIRADDPGCPSEINWKSQRIR